MHFNVFQTENDDSKTSLARLEILVQIQNAKYQFNGIQCTSIHP